MEVCFKAPDAKEVDVVISAELETFIHVWMGYEGYAEAEARGAVSMTGDVISAGTLKQLLGVADSPYERPLAFAPFEAAA